MFDSDIYTDFGSFVSTVWFGLGCIMLDLAHRPNGLSLNLVGFATCSSCFWIFALGYVIGFRNGLFGPLIWGHATYRSRIRKNKIWKRL